MTPKSKPSLWHIGGEDVHFRIPILQRLKKEGFEVAAAGSGSSKPFDEVGIPFYFYPLNRGINPLATKRGNVVLKYLLSEKSPTIVHAFDTKPGIFVPSISREAGVPICIRTITGMGYLYSSNSPPALLMRGLYRALHRRAAGNCDMTIFQNPDDQEYFLKNRLVSAEKTRLVLSSGVDVRAFQEKAPSEVARTQLKQELHIKPDDFVITLVSRLVKWKGIGEYLEVAKNFSQKYPHLKFLLVGPRESEGRQAVPLQWINSATKNVKYLGSRKDIPAILALSHLFVLPSYYREGVPRVLLEAGLMNLPIVTTNMPGCKEVVRPGLTGFIVEPKSAESLAEGIEKILKLSDSERKKFGENSEEFVRENFSLDQVTEKYVNIYRAMLEEKSI